MGTSDNSMGGPITTPDQGEGVLIPLDRVAAIVLGALVVLVTALFANRLGDVAGLLLAAVVMSVTTLPVLRWLRRRIGQPAALVVTAITTIVVCLTLAFVALRDLAARTSQVADLVERRLDELPQDSLIGRMVRATRLDSGVTQWLEGLPSRVVAGAEGGGQLATQVFLFMTVVILATFLQSSGKSIVDWSVSRWPREDDDAGQRRTAHLLADDIECRAFGFFRRVLVLIAACALLVGGVGAAIGLPGAVALGIWVGVWSVVPVVGKFVALAPVIVLVALDQRSVTIAVVAASLVGLGIVHVLRQRWVEPRLSMSVAPYTVAVALGIAVGGIGGSVVALAIVSVIVTVLTSDHRPGAPEWWRVRGDRTWQIGGLTLPTGWRLVALTAGAAAAGVGAWLLIAGLGRAVVWVLVAGFVAIAISRPVGWLTRRTRLPRRVACDVVCLTIGLVIVAATLTGADDGARATTTLTERLPSIVGDLEEAPVIGGWLADHDASVWVEQQMEDLPQRVRTGRPADWMPFVGDRILDLFWIMVLSVALLVDGPRIVAGATGLVAARHRRQWSRLLGAAGVALGGYAAGAALVASINAAVIFVIGVVLGLGVAPALALWGFLWNLVPQIGGFVGGLPLIVFALVLGPLQGLFAGVAFVAYQFIENHLIQPAVIGAAIDIPPWGTLLAAVAGGAAAGVVGAIVLTPLVGVVVVIRSELARDDFPGATVGPHTEQSTSPGAA